MPLTRRESIAVNDAQMARLLATAHLAADAAREFTLPHFRANLNVENKAEGTEFDPVTVADRNSEAAIRKVLLDAYPQHGFFGEESAVVVRPDQLLWVVDPIDGTRAYITGMPLWGTLIALNDGADVLFGLLDQPFLQERYIGLPTHTELQTPFGTRRLTTRKGVSLAQAIMQSTSPDMFIADAEKQAFSRVAERVSMTRFGGDCYAYALLAMGCVDLIIESDLKPFDIQALIPIVRGAGGVLTNWCGNSAVDGGSVVAAGSVELHSQALELLNG